MNLFHLQKRMEQSEKWTLNEILTLEELKKRLCDRFSTVDFESAKRDVAPFLSGVEQEGLELWDADFFTDITERYLQAV